MALRERESAYYFGPTSLNILIFCFFGSVFGLFVVALFVGGFVQGSLFPTITNGSSFISIQMTADDWGKMAIWGFLAGFSERLVPRISSSLANQMDTDP